MLGMSLTINSSYGYAKIGRKFKSTVIELSEARRQSLSYRKVGNYWIFNSWIFLSGLAILIFIYLFSLNKQKNHDKMIEFIIGVLKEGLLMIRRNILLIVLSLLLCSCSNLLNKKDYYTRIGSSDDSYSYCIGKNETIYLYCYSSDEMSALLFDELRDKKGYSLENPRITSKLYDNIIIFDCPSSWDFTIRITCINEFSEINIDTLYLEFSDFIIELPCDISLSYNTSYNDNWIINNISDYNELTHFNYNKQIGFIKILNEDNRFVIGIAPLNNRYNEETIVLNSISPLDNNVSITSTTTATGYITYKSWTIMDLSFEEYILPYALETSKTAYSYFSFEIEIDGDYLMYGFDLKMSFTINGDLQDNIFHVVM